MASPHVVQVSCGQCQPVTEKDVEDIHTVLREMLSQPRTSASTAATTQELQRVHQVTAAHSKCHNLDNSSIRSWQDCILLLFGYRFHIRNSYADGANLVTTLATLAGTWLCADQLEQTPGKGGESQAETAVGQAFASTLADEFKLLLSMMLGVGLTSLYTPPTGCIRFQVTADAVSRIPFQLEYIAVQLHAFQKLYAQIFNQTCSNSSADLVLQDRLRAELEPGAQPNPLLDIHTYPPFLRCLRKRGSEFASVVAANGIGGIEPPSDKLAQYYQKLLALHERIARPGWPDRLRAAGIIVIRDYVRGTATVASVQQFFLPLRESVMFPRVWENLRTTPPVRMAIERLLQTWSLEVVSLDVLRALTTPVDGKTILPKPHNGRQAQLQWYLANVLLNWMDYSLDRGGVLGSARAPSSLTTKNHTLPEIKQYVAEYIPLYDKLYGVEQSPWRCFISQQRALVQWCTKSVASLEQFLSKSQTPNMEQCCALAEQPGPAYMSRSVAESRGSSSPLWQEPADKPHVSSIPSHMMASMYQSFLRDANCQMQIMRFAYTEQKKKAQMIESLLASFIVE